MTVRNLDHLFRPASIAVVGASNRAQSVGGTVMRNLLAGGFEGPILPVNPKRQSIAGVLAYPSVGDLPLAPDLAVICTPPETLPGLIEQLGALGSKAAIVLSAGFGIAQSRDGIDYRKAALEAARPHLLRILGPNCVGLLAPHAGLNASFAPQAAIPGSLAFVSQSGALATAVLDWANSRGIGFSHFVSLGNCWDVDFGDLLDYLGGDPQTRAILLYIESVTSPRKFMSAARAAARNKPVIAIKSGRDAGGAAAAASHTGALAGADEVYEAALRRAGMLRVDRIKDLFDAAELLGREIKIPGDRLAILTNGGGAGVMAADALGATAGRLAELSPETIERLDAVLPVNWSRGNPIDIIGDAPAERYMEAFEALSHSREIDAVLLVQAPTAIVPSSDIAAALLPRLESFPRPILASWLGGESSSQARDLSGRAGIPTFDTPEAAVDAFGQLVAYRRNQTILSETPASVPTEFEPELERARDVIESALAGGRTILSEPEAKELLSCYGIPIVETRVVADFQAARTAASELGFPLALKVLSDDITHKSDVGGVALDIESQEQLDSAIASMSGRVAQLMPNARIKGFTLQPMVRRPEAFELIVGAKNDVLFGPVLLFGQGGTGVEVIADRAVGLPPMNMSLARHLVDETQVARLLRGYRNREGADLEAVYLTIVKISQMVADLRELQELDINPLLADGSGVIALDARVRVAPSRESGVGRLAIRPYPKHLEESRDLSGKTLLIRPIRPEDEPQHLAFLEALAPEDIRFRFFGMVRRFEHSQLARLVQIDFDREMAFIAEEEAGDDQSLTLGVVRVVCDPDGREAEFAIVVHSMMKGRGLGTLLLQKAVDYCRSRGVEQIVGQVLADNTAMLALAKKFGFRRRTSPDKTVKELRLRLREA